MISSVLRPEGVVTYVERKETELSAENFPSKSNVEEEFDYISILHYIFFTL